MIAADHLALLMNKPIADVCRGGKLLAEGLLLARERYHSELLIVFADVSVEAEALGVRLDYYDHSNPSIHDHLDIAEIKSRDITSEGRVPQLLLAAEICRHDLGNEFPIFYSMKDPFSLAALLIGPDQFFEMLVTAPERVRDLLNVCTQIQATLLERVIFSGYLPLVGAPFASGSLIGSKYFALFVKPYLAELYDIATAHQSCCCLHLCGKIDMLASELADLHLDLFSFEDFYPPMWEAMQDTVPMGFIPTEFFLQGSAEKLKAATTRCIQVLPEPMVLSSGCDLPAKADPELVRLMMET